jgi:hypothetical protein
MSEITKRGRNKRTRSYLSLPAWQSSSFASW